MASALAVLEEQGYDTIVCNVDSPLERDRHLEALLPTHRADGVLAVCLPLSRDQLHQFARAGVALVSVDAANPGVPQTVIDDVAGGRLATGHLIALGHRRIGFVGDMPFARPPAGLGFTSSANRLRGYKQALAGAGIRVEPGLIRRGPHDAAAAAEHAAQLLKSPDPPSAIFAASDTQAIGVLAAADRLGVAVPGAPVGRRVRRHRVRGLPRPQHRPAAAGPQRGRGRAPAVRAAARGTGPPAAAGTTDRADGARQFGAALGLADPSLSGPWASGLGMADEITLAGHADDHALTFEDLQGTGGHPM